MRKLLVMLFISSSLVVCGCAKEEKPPQSQGLEIHAPGVDVTLDPEHGLHVEAPGTEVNVNKEEGVRVQAPGVDVEAAQEKSGR